MRVDWYGQAAFRLSGADGTVFIDPFGDVSPPGRAGDAVRLSRRSRTSTPICCWSRTSTCDHNGVETVGGNPTDPALDRGTPRVPARRDRRDRVRARRGRRHASADPTRSSCSRSTACASPTSATSASARCATSRPTRSARSTCCSCRSAAARRSAASRPLRSRIASLRNGSCRCTTARRGSASSRRPMPSSRRCPRSTGSSETGFDTDSLRGRRRPPRRGARRALVRGLVP